LNTKIDADRSEDEDNALSVQHRLWRGRELALLCAMRVVAGNVHFLRRVRVAKAQPEAAATTGLSIAAVDFFLARSFIRRFGELKGKHQHDAEANADGGGNLPTVSPTVVQQLLKEFV
jgi:hypothetical protein